MWTALGGFAEGDGLHLRNRQATRGWCFARGGSMPLLLARPTLSRGRFRFVALHDFRDVDGGLIEGLLGGLRAAQSFFDREVELGHVFEVERDAGEIAGVGDFGG